jgi:hypothetical protein
MFILIYSGYYTYVKRHHHLKSKSIRSCERYKRIAELVGGRDLTAMLPKLFLDPFHDTSFVIIRSCLQKCFKWTSYCLIGCAQAVKS